MSTAVIQKPSWAFAGCKPQAVMVARALVERGYCPRFISVLPNLSHEDMAPMQELAASLDVPCLVTPNLREHEHLLRAVDMLLVCRFNVLPMQVFAAPRLGSVNIHSSLLPAYRGVHPVSWALINGESDTGVTLHCVNEGIDTGDIVMQRRVPIHDDHDIWSLTHELNQESAAMSVALFEYMCVHGQLPPRKRQIGPASYARRRNESDSKIEWNRSARSIFNLVRALQPPYPLAFAHKPDGAVVRIKSCQLTTTEACVHLPGEITKRADDGRVHVTTADTEVVVCTDQALHVGDILM